MSLKFHFLLKLVIILVPAVLVQIHLHRKSTAFFSSDMPEFLYDELANANTMTTSSSPIIVPDALEPTDYTGCCVPDRFNQGRQQQKETQSTNIKLTRKRPNMPTRGFHEWLTQGRQQQRTMRVNDPWLSTCFTPRACENHTLYPFQSVEEQEFMHEHQFVSKAERIRHRETCAAAAKQLHPEVTWCRVTNTSSNNLSIPESFHPTGCSQFTMGGSSGPYDRMIIYPGAKLAFCGIPKSGVTRWLQFLRFTLGAKDYQDAPYHKLDQRPFTFDRLTETAQHEIWNDPAWTRAVLIREPTERLLSAYLDKIVRRKDHYRNLTLAEFVSYLEQPEQEGIAGLSWRTDPHWRPQAYSCGMVQLLPQFHFVGGLDRVAEHSRRILDQVGLWESHGRHYRTTNHRAIKNPPPPLEVPTLGFQQEIHTADHHSRGAESKLDAYYTPELRDRVRKLYWMDYALWDAVQQANDEGKHHGKDVAAILNPEECSSSADSIIISR